VREAEKVEALGLGLAARSPIRRRVAAEFEESRFVRVQRQTEPRESLTQLRQKLLSVVSMFEPPDKVIGEANDDHVAVRLPLSPSVGPEVEDVVEVDVGQQRAHHAPYAKGNFQFDRVIVGWREQPVLDLRRK
jgi:hypothetical protein